jgi:hypothetical protein
MLKIVDGEEVKCTPEEEVAILAQWAQPPEVYVDPRIASLQAAGFNQAQIDAILGL